MSGILRTARRGASVLPVVAGLLAMIPAGCSTKPGQPVANTRPVRGPIGEIHLFGVPVALDLDGRPGPDAIGVRLYANPSDRARGMPIKDGTIEVLMFDGTVGPESMDRVKPLRVWTFTALQLAPFVTETSLGTGYQLGLAWEDNRPRGNAVTVVARYRSASGAMMLSTASSISIDGK